MRAPGGSPRPVTTRRSCLCNAPVAALHATHLRVVLNRCAARPGERASRRSGRPDAWFCSWPSGKPAALCHRPRGPRRPQIRRHGRPCDRLGGGHATGFDLEPEWSTGPGHKQFPERRVCPTATLSSGSQGRPPQDCRSPMSKRKSPARPRQRACRGSTGQDRCLCSVRRAPDRRPSAPASRRWGSDGVCAALGRRAEADLYRSKLRRLRQLGCGSQCSVAAEAGAGRE
jgi:hypothetical protein